MDNATLDISEARKQFSKMDEHLQRDPLIWITRHNKKAFAVVNMELMNAVLETFQILNDPEALQMLRESIEDIKHGRLYDHEDVKKELLG